MKHLHKFASVLLALVMALSLMVPAFAAEGEEVAPPPAEETTTGGETTANLTVPDLSGHIYYAYQIFTGTQAESEGALADVQWGKGINSEDFIQKLIALGYKTDEGEKVFTDGMTAAQVAEGIARYADETEQANAIAQAAFNAKMGDGTKLENTTTLDTGYYLIVDQTTFGDGETNTVVNAALLQLTNDITIKTKVSVPAVDKKVQENSDGEYGEAADYNIGDDVPFQFISAVPDMSQFETYKYVFHDTMSAGLSFNADSVEVQVGPSTVPATEYEVVTEGLTDGCTFEIVFDDLKSALAQTTNAVTGAPIIVTFTAELTDKAVIGGGGNSNTVKLEYSNNPNDDGDGNPPTGETPEDEVLVFTYELDTDKVNGNKEPLKDAKFRLARKVKDENGAETNEYEWATIANGKITGWEKASEGQQFGGTELTTPESGKFEIEGLDAGTYYLWETKAPAGYNTPEDPFVVVISRELTQIDGKEGYTDLKVTIDGEAGKDETTMDSEKEETGSGTVGVEVVNQSGATLPETGGTGTTIFYIVGGLLTVGAVVLLVTKKRMSVDSDK